MKKLLTILVVLSLLVIACTAALAQRGPSANCPRSCPSANFTDVNGDGLCDNRFQGCGIRGANFIDADGDGLCDNRAQGRGCGRGFGRGQGCGMRCD